MADSELLISLLNGVAGTNYSVGQAVPPTWSERLIKGLPLTPLDLISNITGNSIEEIQQQVSGPPQLWLKLLTKLCGTSPTFDLVTRPLVKGSRRTPLSLAANILNVSEPELLRAVRSVSDKPKKSKHTHIIPPPEVVQPAIEATQELPPSPAKKSRRIEEDQVEEEEFVVSEASAEAVALSGLLRDVLDIDTVAKTYMTFSSSIGFTLTPKVQPELTRKIKIIADRWCKMIGEGDFKRFSDLIQNSGVSGALQNLDPKYKFIYKLGDTGLYVYVPTILNGLDSVEQTKFEALFSLLMLDYIKNNPGSTLQDFKNKILLQPKADITYFVSLFSDHIDVELPADERHTKKSRKELENLPVKLSSYGKKEYKRIAEGIKSRLFRIYERQASALIGDTFEGVNRNDPCPCGSGKKFKKCHGLVR